MSRSFLQTELWGTINNIYNGQVPVKVGGVDISCMFGYDRTHQVLSACAGPEISDSCNLAKWDDFFAALQVLSHRAKKIIFSYSPPLRDWDDSIEELFSKYNFCKLEWKTILLNLSASKEELFRGLKHSVRKNINKSARSNLTIERCNNFEEYYNRFLLNYNLIKNQKTKPYDIALACWNILDQHKIYNYWVLCNQQGEILGVLGSYRYDGIATEIMSATSSLSYSLGVPAQDLLHWEAICYHKDVGDKYFDFAGFNPNPLSEKERQIAKFKQKWGGKEYSIPSFYRENINFLQKIKRIIKHE